MATQATDGRAVNPPVPDFVTIYAPDGSPHICAPVDANEILAAGAGYTRQRPEVVVEQQPEQQSILDDAVETQAEDGEESGEKTTGAAKRKGKK